MGNAAAKNSRTGNLIFTPAPLAAFSPSSGSHVCSCQFLWHLLLVPSSFDVGEHPQNGERSADPAEEPNPVPALPPVLEM